MLSKRRFQEQMHFLSTYFMRKMDVELLDTYWPHLKDKEQEIWDKALDQVVSKETRFPVIPILQNYYEMNLSPKEDVHYPRMEDLESAAKTGKHKYYLKLIYGLLNDKIRIDDPRVQKCLDEQGGKKVFERFDPKKRIFKKCCR